MIGMTDENGKLPESPFKVKDMSTETPGHKILVQPCYVDHNDHVIKVAHLLGHDDKRRAFCWGSTLLVHNSSLDIMHRASDGRLTPQRFWRLALAAMASLALIMVEWNYPAYWATKILLWYPVCLWIRMIGPNWRKWEISRR